jgi:hypothetical protein
LRRVVALLFLIAAHAAAQHPLTPAPRVLQVFRESIRAGREPAYFGNEAKLVANLARLEFPMRFLAFSAITGSSELWSFVGYDSYADVDQLSAAIGNNPECGRALGEIAGSKDGLINDGRTLFAHYREDMSFGRGISSPRPRYFVITVVSVRAGHERDYAELCRLQHVGHQRAGLTDIHSVYAVASGGQDATFIVITPAGSLEEAGTSRINHGRRFDEALGPQAARLHELQRTAVIGSETNIYAIRPDLSLPAKDWVDADPEFWKKP